MVTEMLKHLHGVFGRHPGITAAIINFGSKNYYPNMPKLIRNWIISCQKCIREEDRQLIDPPPSPKSKRIHNGTRRCLTNRHCPRLATVGRI